MANNAPYTPKLPPAPSRFRRPRSRLFPAARRANHHCSFGQLAGIRFYLHYSWFIIFFASCITLALTFHAAKPHWSITQSALVATITALFFFVSLILHELGHAVVAKKHDIPVHSITLFIFGGVARIGREPDTAGAEFQVAIAGPLVSVALSAFFFLLYGFTLTHFDSAATIFETLVLVNLVIAVFNMLPGFPLDGGRVLRAAVWRATGNRQRAHRWAMLCGRGVALALIGLGLMLMFYFMHPLNGLWMIGIGGFILVSGK